MTLLVVERYNLSIRCTTELYVGSIIDSITQASYAAVTEGKHGDTGVLAAKFVPNELWSWFSTN